MGRRPSSRAVALWCAIVVGLGQLGCVQSIAWCGMLAARAASMPLQDAIATTFDGRHPCGLCAQVQAERERDAKRPGSVLDELGKQLACLAPAGDVAIVAAMPRPPGPCAPAPMLGIGRAEPPTPPPRG